MIVMIDNYDSFTYNLLQYIEQLGTVVKVFRNDSITNSQIEALNPQGIVISPGPGRPESAGISMDVVKHFSNKIPILGVCLGHQAIAAAFGGKIIHAKCLMHGKTSIVKGDGEAIYRGIRPTFTAMRYHSLVVSENDLPSCFIISARSEDGDIMGIRHEKYQIEGIQFHPESIMTRVGKKLLRNFLDQTKKEDS